MTTHTRRGTALAVALFALVSIGAIAQAMLAPAMASRRAAWRTSAVHSAEAAAERSLAHAVGGRTPPEWQALQVGESVADAKDVQVGDRPALAARVATRISRLDAEVFAVVARAVVPMPDVDVAAQRSMLVELRPMSPAISAALTAGGTVRLAADSDVATAADCARDSLAPPAALLVAPWTSVTRGGMAFDQGVTRDAAAADGATYAAPSRLSLAHLLEAAGVLLPGGSTVAPGPAEDAGRCESGGSNWGGGGGACAGYFPVVFVAGDLRIASGSGQGTLIVAGRLAIVGEFTFRGLIVASGGIQTTGGPVTITGAVYTAPDGSVTFGVGPTVIRASSCALADASRSAPLVKVVPLRGWWR